MEQETSLEIMNQQVALNRNPKEVLNDALMAAKELQNVIRTKRKPVIFNGEQYLEFEDWQTCARFYGLSAMVVSTNYVEYGDVKGWEAKAQVLRNADGAIISGADSMCLNDEKNWAGKPLFQLRSMAQTRACAKALRNVLAWVAVLAGYKPTPAEEMDGVRSYGHSDQNMAETGHRTQKKGTPTEVPDDQLANWIMPGGKYAGLTLSHILGETTEAGKAKGLEYLQWCITEEAKIKPETKTMISRFLKQMDV